MAPRRCQSFWPAAFRKPSLDNLDHAVSDDLRRGESTGQRGRIPTRRERTCRLPARSWPTSDRWERTNAAYTGDREPTASQTSTRLARAKLRKVAGRARTRRRAATGDVRSVVPCRARSDAGQVDPCRRPAVAWRRTTPLAGLRTLRTTSQIARRAGVVPTSEQRRLFRGGDCSDLRVVRPDDKGIGVTRSEQSEALQEGE